MAKTAKIFPKICLFRANFWPNFGEIMRLFDTTFFEKNFGWELAQNWLILGPFLAEYMA